MRHSKRNRSTKAANNAGTGRYNLFAAVLAGGQSKRMGQDKALLQIGSKPMIKRVVEAVLTQVPDVMIVSNDLATYSFLRLPVYPDAVHDCGPLGGIYTALLHSKFQHCLVVACDLPYLSKGLLQFLCENCAPYDVLAFESEAGVEPLCAVYSKRCLSVIRKQIKAGQYKVSDFYDLVNTRLVRLEPKLAFFDPKSFINVNTQEELAKAREFLKNINRKNK
jgi:molybdopterin-guanine dinucleotide biosynthesis protein A